MFFNLQLIIRLIHTLVIVFRPFSSILLVRVFVDYSCNFPETNENLKFSSKLHICNYVNGDWNYQFETEDLVVRKWFNLKIKQTENSGSYEYSILIDDKQVLSKKNTTPKVWNNVQAEFGRIKDVSGFQIARGFYRNLRVTSEYLVLQSDL